MTYCRPFDRRIDPQKGICVFVREQTKLNAIMIIAIRQQHRRLICTTNQHHHVTSSSATEWLVSMASVTTIGSHGQRPIGVINCDHQTASVFIARPPSVTPCIKSLKPLGNFAVALGLFCAALSSSALQRAGDVLPRMFSNIKSSDWIRARSKRVGAFSAPLESANRTEPLNVVLRWMRSFVQPLELFAASFASSASPINDGLPPGTAPNLPENR